MDESIVTCKISGGKLECEADPGSIPTMPVRAAWIVIIISFILLIIAAVLNHVIFSVYSPAYVIPFFGGIEIARATLYDITLILFIVAPVMITIAFTFTIKHRTRIITIDGR